MEKGDRKSGGSEHPGGSRELQRVPSPAPGKVTRTSTLARGEPSVQRKVAAPAAAPTARSRLDFTMDPWMDAAHRGVTALAESGHDAVQARGDVASSDPESVHRSAAAGVSGGGAALPYLDQIQASFGGHDLSGVRAHTGSDAQAASEQIGAQAYATGNQIAFAGAPDLHTAAHEAAHVVQQRAGVQLSGGVGQAGDAYERHADAVADRVASGQSAADLLATSPGGSAAQGTGNGSSQASTGVQSAVQGDWLGAGLGALGGAAAGAGIGAVAGPVGAAVGGVIGAVAGAMGGHFIEEATSSSTVLSDDTVKAVEEAINTGRKQDAINALVTDLAGQGRIDTGVLQGGGFTYDATVAGEGVANPPGYDAAGKALPTDVRIGDDAFTGGVTLLHTSIMHEYWHVQQFQDAGSSPSVVPGQGGGSVIDQQEVEAYCWEIEHAGETGLESKPNMMEDAWNRLHNNYWVNLSAADKVPLLAQVTRCHEIAERVAGKTLVFTP